METEKNELFDFENNDTLKAEKKQKKSSGGKAAKAAMAGAAAVAGGATAIGAEAAMSLSDEMIVDPEMVAEGIEESTVEVSAPRPQRVHHAPKAEVQPTEGAAPEEAIAAAHEVNGSANADENAPAEDGEAQLPIAENDQTADVAEVVEPIELENVTELDVAEIIENEVPVVVPGDDMLPIVDDSLDDVQLAMGSDFESDEPGEDLSFIDDLV